VCRLDLYADVFNHQPIKVFKQKFYTAEEYLAYQKSLLISDLKTHIGKQAQPLLSKLASQPRFQLRHRQKLKKFYALEFTQIAAEAEPVKISAHDLVLAVLAGSTTPHS
jgi:predicted NAD-dependent protein-ADP-ribosyltransferase YbiA (DUF1768 family)